MGRGPLKGALPRPKVKITRSRQSNGNREFAKSSRAAGHFRSESWNETTAYSRNCQTFAASPAQPGGAPSVLEKSIN
jgi:hypothetical protein